MSAKKRSDGGSSKSFFLFSREFWAHASFRIVVAGLVAAGGWMCYEMARSHAVTLPDFQVTPANLKITSKPAWVEGPIEEQLADMPGKDTTISLLDTKATEKVAANLRANPWVKDVKSVVREFPDRIRARVELREPAAYVLRSGKYYIVDSTGFRLPGEYPAPSDAGLDLLLIVYVRSMPPAEGTMWNDPAVVEGAKVAAFLNKYDDLVKQAKVTAIDTSNVGGRRTPREADIALITEDQTKILWGKGLDAPIGRELAPESKLANLKAVIDQERNLAEQEYVDLRFPNPVFRPRRYYLGAL